MSEMYVPGRDPSTEAGAAKSYGGGYDDLGGPPGVDDDDRVMYQPGMDLGDVKPGMYGASSVDDDDGYDYDENNFQKPRGGRGGPGSKGRSSSSSRSSVNSRKTLDVEVEESPPRRRSGQDGPNGESKGASGRAGRGEKGGVNGSSKKKKGNPNRGRGGSAAFDDLDDDVPLFP